MTAKHLDRPEPATPPCTIGLGEAAEQTRAEVARAVAHERKQLGQLNGPWVRAYKVTQTIVFPALLTISGWLWTELRALNAEIGELKKSNAVLQQVVSQIKTNAEILQRHDRDLAALQAQFVTRTSARDREMDENRTAHTEIMSEQRRLGEKMDRLSERIAARE